MSFRFFWFGLFFRCEEVVSLQGGQPAEVSKLSWKFLFYVPSRDPHGPTWWHFSVDDFPAFTRWDMLVPWRVISCLVCCVFLGGGFKYFLCSPLPGEMIQLDIFFKWVGSTTNLFYQHCNQITHWVFPFVLSFEKSDIFQPVWKPPKLRFATRHFAWNLSHHPKLGGGGNSNIFHFLD